MRCLLLGPAASLVVDEPSGASCAFGCLRLPLSPLINDASRICQKKGIESREAYGDPEEGDGIMHVLPRADSYDLHVMKFYQLRFFILSTGEGTFIVVSSGGHMVASNHRAGVRGVHSDGVG